MTSRCSRVADLVGLLACGQAAHAQSQSWDKQLPASKRFDVLADFGGEAVLDKETGLLWERTPGDVNGDGVLSSDDQMTWFSGLNRCRTAVSGNRQGWRLPTYQELASLIDPSVPSSPEAPIRSSVQHGH